MAEDMVWFLMPHQSGISQGGCPRSASAQQSEVLMTSPRGSSLSKDRAAELELSREEAFGAVLSLLEGNSLFPTGIFQSAAVSPQKGLEKGPGWMGL